MTRTPAAAISLRNDSSEIASLHRFLDEFFERHGVAEPIQLPVRLSLEELLVNTINYGFDDGQQHHIEIRLALLADRIEVTIDDDGREFDLRNAPPPALEAPLEDRRVGGLGIHLVRSLMDHVQYTRQEGRNIVVLTKKLAP